MLKNTVIETNKESIHIKLIDGVERNAKNPNTFLIPSWGMREFAQPGMNVKIYAESSNSVMGERFWVQITDRLTGENGKIYYSGIIDNNLVTIDAKRGDFIQYFSPKNIIDISTEEFMNEIEKGLCDIKKINPKEFRQFVNSIE